jgi:tetratricopeptide (TPR) repeat protein
MAWLSTTLTLTAIVLVALQGFSFFSRARTSKASSTSSAGVGAGSKAFVDFFLPDGTASPHARLGGALNLLLAASGLIAFLLFHAGAVTASPEYSVLLVQGPVAQVSTWLLLIGVSLAAGLIWQAARVAKGLHSHLVWISVLGIAVGVAAVCRIQAVNPVDPTAFCIRFYDMWWPPLLLWTVTCVSQWAATTFDVREAWARIIWAIFFVVGSALIPLHRTLQGLWYGDPWSQPVWKIVILCGIPVCTAAAAAELTKQLTWRPRAGICLLVGYAGFAGAAWWTEVHRPWLFQFGALYTAKFHLSWIFQPWVLWAVSATTLVIYFQIRRKSLALPLSHRSLLANILALVAVVVIGLSLADMSHFILLDPAWDLAALILAWIILLEVIAESPLAAFGVWATGKTRKVGVWLRRVSVHVLKLESQAAASTDMPSGSKNTAGAGSTPKLSLLVKLIAALAILTAVAEIPNAGKTLVRPFTTLGIKDGPQKAGEDKKQLDEYKRELGQAVSDRVANTLALVGEEMGPDLLVAWHHESSLERPWIPATSLGTDGVQTAVKSNNVEIPGTTITIPMEFLTLPIQGPVRWLLKVGEIHGSIEPDGEQYILLATSSTGRTWRIRAEMKDGGRTWSVPGIPLDPCVGSYGPPTQAQDAMSGELNPADALAYKIVSSDERLLKLGGASSWTAIQPFLDGASAWKKFEQTNDYRYLTRSLCEFRRATNEDPAFALAQYRLGRALTADGQPAAAVAAFRASLQANPTFVAGHIALANILYDFEGPYYLPGAEVLDQPDISQSDDAACRNRKEAIALWRRVIQDLPAESSIPDQAAAYIGLCHSIMDQAEDPSSRYDQSACKTKGAESRSQSIGLPEQRSRYAALFYCKRAEYLYSKLPDLLRNDAPVRDARASALSQIGEILDSTPFAPMPDPPQRGLLQPSDWSCDIDTKDASWLIRAAGPYTSFARSYYKQAMTIQPGNWTARCYFAIDSLALGNLEPMRELEADNFMHRRVGDSWWTLAGKTDGKEKQDANTTIAANSYYSRALKEFKRAVDLSPFDARSKNDYAYTVWQWRVRHHMWSEPSPLKDVDVKDMDLQAEEYARQAVSLSQNRDITTQMIMQSTLQELLLDRALMTGSKMQEPPKVIKDIPDHAYFDELRWDLAQVDLCLNSNDGARSEGVQLLKQIATNEKAREVRPYTDAKLLDPQCYLLQPSPFETGTRQSHSDVPKRTAESLTEPAPAARVALK